jgi:very-short-patch-repair endonuclease
MRQSRQRTTTPWGQADASAIAILAERQHGVVSRAQLRAIGLSDTTIDRYVERGWLHRVHRGVFAVGHKRLSEHGRFLAAVLASGAGALVSHLSAAALWGLTSTTGKPHVTATVRRKHHDITTHRSLVPQLERSQRHGIPLTTVPRTLVDIAVTEPARLERLVREADVLKLLDWTELQAIAERYARKPGTRALRRLINDGRPITRSGLEDRFRATLRKARLPEPIYNARIDLGDLLIEVDCFWPEHKLVVELDGHAFHGTRAAFESDRERDRKLQSAGLRVIRITWRQLRDQSAAVAGDIRNLLSPS